MSISGRSVNDASLLFPHFKFTHISFILRWTLEEKRRKSGGQKKIMDYVRQADRQSVSLIGSDWQAGQLGRWVSQVIDGLEIQAGKWAGRQAGRVVGDRWVSSG